MGNSYCKELFFIIRFREDLRRFFCLFIISFRFGFRYLFFRIVMSEFGGVNDGKESRFSRIS